MTDRMRDIITAIHVARERIQLCNETIYRLEDNALAECPVALGDVVTTNEGSVHIGKPMQVLERSLHLSDSEMRKPHWSFNGPIIKADGLVSYRHSGRSIQKID